MRHKNGSITIKIYTTTMCFDLNFLSSVPDHSRPVDAEGQTSAQSTPDLGSLTEFHQLILLRLLRPDRFPVAMAHYVRRHLTSVQPLASSAGSLLGSAQRLLGVLVLLPPTPAFGNRQLGSGLKMKAKPVDILKAIAQVRTFRVFKHSS